MSPGVAGRLPRGDLGVVSGCFCGDLEAAGRPGKTKFSSAQTVSQKVSRRFPRKSLEGFPESV